MKQSVMKAWVKRLRNPNMRQAQGQLKDGRGYCCLGHLCVVLGAKFEKEGNHCETVKYSGGEYLTLPDEIITKAGMHSDNGELPKPIEIKGSICSSLACLNDCGMSLPKIADVIEKHWRTL